MEPGDWFIYVRFIDGGSDLFIGDDKDSAKEIFDELKEQNERAEEPWIEEMTLSQCKS